MKPTLPLTEGPPDVAHLPLRGTSRIGQFAVSADGVTMNSSIETLALFGLPISNVTQDEAVHRITELIESGACHQIATANLDFARHALASPLLQRVLCDCAMVVPDGAPLIWASWLFGRPLKQRVTGVDLVPALARLSASRGYRMFFLGSSEESSAIAAAELERQFPAVKIVGRYSPPIRPLEKMNDEEILSRIEAVKPDIMLVAFGNPKQELWLHRNRHRLRVPVSIGVGGSLDMIAGSLKRAPGWLQSIHMEWIFRMVQEPARLVPRYAHDFSTLARHLPSAWLASTMQPKGGGAWPLEIAEDGNTRLLRLPEHLTGEHCATVEREAELAVQQRQMLIMDMTLTRRVEADGLGCLLAARRILTAASLPVWVVGATESLRRVLERTALSGVVRLAVTIPEAVAQSAVPERRVQFSPYRGAERRTTAMARRGPQAVPEKNSVAPPDPEEGRSTRWNERRAG